MAKRFIDTGFFKSPFVRGLKGPLKGLYTYIICDCDGSGIWTFDLEIASMYIGFKVTLQEFNDSFVKSGKAIDLNNGKYFFPDFLDHQYPKGLSRANPAQINFISELNKYGLLDDALKPLKRPFDGSKVMVTVKEEVMEKEEVKSEKNETFESVHFNDLEFSKLWDTIVQEPKWRKKTKSALQASLKKLDGQTLEIAKQMLSDSIAGGWQGLFEPKQVYKPVQQTESNKLQTFLTEAEKATAYFENQNELLRQKQQHEQRIE